MATETVQLADFIKNSLTQIIDGVVAAQEYAKGKGAKINPANSWIADGELILHDGRRSTIGPLGDLGQMVEFDLSVAAEKTDQAQGGVGVMGAIVGIGVRGKVEESNTATSRLKFKVPIFFPEQQA